MCSSNCSIHQHKESSVSRGHVTVRIPGIMNSIRTPTTALTWAPPPAGTPNGRTCPDWTSAAAPWPIIRWRLLLLNRTLTAAPWPIVWWRLLPWRGLRVWPPLTSTRRVWSLATVSFLFRRNRPAKEGDKYSSWIGVTLLPGHKAWPTAFRTYY